MWYAGIGDKVPAHAMTGHHDDVQGHRLMPSAHQLGTNFCDLCAHTRLHRQALDREVALPGGRTAMCESHEVEGFWFVLSPALAVSRRKSTKLDQASLFCVQGQSKLAQTLLHGYKEAVGHQPVLESERAVVRVAHYAHSARYMPASPLPLPSRCKVEQMQSRAMYTSMPNLKCSPTTKKLSTYFTSRRARKLFCLCMVGWIECNQLIN